MELSVALGQRTLGSNFRQIPLCLCPEELNSAYSRISPIPAPVSFRWSQKLGADRRALLPQNYLGTHAT